MSRADVDESITRNHQSGELVVYPDQNPEADV